jgi:D-arabinose 1-dehydrogenase-like Zn-dependent alcohol dehydrogenase
MREGYRISAWGSDPVWETFERPRPAEDEALVRVDACSIGLTVLNMIRGDLADERATLPRVPGHELVGSIVDVGSERHRGRVGERVTDYIYLFCGSCVECVAGREDRCLRLAGYIGVHRDGGYATYTVLPIRNLIRLPGDLDPVSATVIPDAVSTSVHVCRSRAKVRPDDTVAVIGAGGGVGAHLVQVAQLHGAAVIGLDVEDDKLAMVADLGARAVRSDDFEALDPRLGGRSAPTVVIDLVGSAASLSWALGALGPGGRLVVLTTFRDVRAELDPRQLVMSEIQVLGSRYATRHEVGLAVDLVAKGRVRPIIGETTRPAGVLEVHERLRNRRLVGRGALDWT